MKSSHDAISPWSERPEAVAKASEEALAATARANEAEERAKLTEATALAGWIFRGVPMDFQGISWNKYGNVLVEKKWES